MNVHQLIGVPLLVTGLDMISTSSLQPLLETSTSDLWVEETNDRTSYEDEEKIAMINTWLPWENDHNH